MSPAVSSPPAMYVDPGTGSFLLQMIIAGVAGALVTVKLFWSRLRDRFRKTPAPPRD